MNDRDWGCLPAILLSLALWAGIIAIVWAIVRRLLG